MVDGSFGWNIQNSSGTLNFNYNSTTLTNDETILNTGIVVSTGITKTQSVTQNTPLLHHTLMEHIHILYIQLVIVYIIQQFK